MDRLSLPDQEAARPRHNPLRQRLEMRKQESNTRFNELKNKKISVIREIRELVDRILKEYDTSLITYEYNRTLFNRKLSEIIDRDSHADLREICATIEGFNENFTILAVDVENVIIRDGLGERVSEALNNFEKKCSDASSFLAKLKAKLESKERRQKLDAAKKENPYALSERDWEYCKELINELEKAPFDTPKHKDIVKILDRYNTSIRQGNKIPISENRGSHWSHYQDDMRDITDQLEGTSLSRHYSAHGWQGTSAQTFEAFIRKIIKDLRVDRYKDIEILKDAIYNIYTSSNKNSYIDKQEDEQYIDSFNKNLEQAWNNNKQLEQIEVKHKPGYAHFKHIIEKQPREMRRRYSLNIDPDKIPEVGPKILQETVLLPYVYDVKISETKSKATQRLDNIIIFSYNSADGKNKEDLEQILRPYQPYTRSGHPAMLEPLDPKIQGIAFADQSSSHLEGTGWGRTRIRHIADVMWEFKLRGEEITFKKLLSKVKERYRENNIDPEHPYRNLPST